MTELGGSHTKYLENYLFVVTISNMVIWDEAKREKNLRAHGIDFAELECVFEAPLVTVEDDREPLWRAKTAKFGLVLQPGSFLGLD